MAAQIFSEADMYLPIKNFFERLGYAVFSEVNHCDIAMKKDDELIIVEMKKNFTVDLLIQGLDRKRMTSSVFIAVPRPVRCYGDKFTGMVKLVKKLELGLLFVSMDSPVKIVEGVVFPDGSTQKLTPRGRARRNQILTEMSGRTMDLNTGGSRGKKLMTASREKSIHIACAYEVTGEAKPSVLVKRFQCDKKTGAIVYRNFHQWFRNIEPGVYDLSATGKSMLNGTEFREIIDYYRNKVQTTLTTFENE